MGKEPTAHYVVPWAVQLEEKQIALAERPKLARAPRLPEVHFLKRSLRPQEIKPRRVGNTYIRLHRFGTALTTRCLAMNEAHMCPVSLPPDVSCILAVILHELREYQ